MNEEKINTKNTEKCVQDWNFRIFSAEINYDDENKKLNKNVLKLDDWNVFEETDGFVVQVTNNDIKELDIDLSNFKDLDTKSKENLKNFLDENKTRFGHTLTLWYDIENKKILCWKAFFKKTLLLSILEAIFNNYEIIYDLKQKNKILKSDFKNTIDQCFSKININNLTKDERLEISRRENCKFYLGYSYDSNDLKDKVFKGLIKRISNTGELTLEGWNIEETKTSYVVPESNKNLGEFNIDLSNGKKLNDISDEVKNDLKIHLDELRNKNGNNIAIWYDDKNKKFIFNTAYNTHELKFAIMLSIWENKDSIYDIENQKNIFKNQYSDLLNSILIKNSKKTK